MLQQWTPEQYFFLKMFAEITVILIAFLWVDVGESSGNILSLIGLMLTYYCYAAVYNSMRQNKEEKEKLFYIALMTFLIRNQKFTFREGS